MDYPPHRPLTLGQIWDRLSAAVRTIGHPPLEPLTEPAVTQHCDRDGNYKSSRTVRQGKKSPAIRIRQGDTSTIHHRNTSRCSE